MREARQGVGYREPQKNSSLAQTPFFLKRPWGKAARQENAGNLPLAKSVSKLLRCRVNFAETVSRSRKTETCWISQCTRANFHESICNSKYPSADTSPEKWQCVCLSLPMIASRPNVSFLSAILDTSIDRSADTNISETNSEHLH